MKNGLKLMNLKMMAMMLLFTVMQTVLWAQDPENTTTSTKKVDVTVENTETWYSSPWIWVVGAAVFILLLVALTSGGRRRAADSTTDRVTVTKTVERDTDV